MSSTVVWVTGASQGIGRAVVDHAPFDDATIFDISRRGGVPGTTHVPADLADPSGWVAVEAHVRDTLGDFDGDRAVFIHCAGTLEPMGYAAEVDTERYRRQVLLNSAAPQALGQAFLSAAAHLAGRVEFVQLTSGAASKPYEGWSAYCAGKAAGDHWVRTVGCEQTTRGAARVLAIAPGVVDTNMQQLIRDTDERDFPAVSKFRQLHRDGQLTDPTDAAERIWKVLDRDDLETGSVVDLRTLT